MWCVSLQRDRKKYDKQGKCSFHDKLQKVIMDLVQYKQFPEKKSIFLVLFICGIKKGLHIKVLDSCLRRNDINYDSPVIII